jgi:two-component system, NtrC family, sensor kinase
MFNLFQTPTKGEPAQSTELEHTKLLSNILENSPTPTFVINKDHKIILWNKACEKFTQVDSSEMIGTDKQWTPFYEERRPVMADLVIDNNPTDIPKLYTTYSRPNPVVDGLFNAEGWYPNVGGLKRYILFTAVPITDDTGQTIAAIETFEDISDKKIQEEKLVKKLTEIEQLNKFMVDRELKMVELKKELGQKSQ